MFWVVGLVFLFSWWRSLRAVRHSADCALHLQGRSGNRWRDPNALCIMKHPPLCSWIQLSLIIWPVCFYARCCTVVQTWMWIACEGKFAGLGRWINIYLLLSTSAFKFKINFPVNHEHRSKKGKRTSQQEGACYSVFHTLCFHLFVDSLKTEHLKTKNLTLPLCPKSPFTPQISWTN